VSWLPIFRCGFSPRPRPRPRLLPLPLPRPVPRPRVRSRLRVRLRFRLHVRSRFRLRVRLRAGSRLCFRTRRNLEATGPLASVNFHDQSTFVRHRYEKVIAAALSSDLRNTDPRRSIS
jgi:hypothetical protein